MNYKTYKYEQLADYINCYKMEVYWGEITPNDVFKIVIEETDNENLAFDVLMGLEDYDWESEDEYVDCKEIW